MTDITIFQFEHTLKSWAGRFHKGKAVTVEVQDDSQAVLKVRHTIHAFFSDMNACYIYMRDAYRADLLREEAEIEARYGRRSAFHGQFDFDAELRAMAAEEAKFHEQVKATRWSDEDAAKVAAAFSKETVTTELEITIDGMNIVTSVLVPKHVTTVTVNVNGMNCDLTIVKE